ncbi:hypothetical protein [Saccharothrix yanglingensis]|uniref:hypothetical protein n=1 Tax=Saccharothrix yanglingensis TaxID=659496 RepID=UPI0027D26612|nr:hypothetical protein [Saccharothrix yanglingensis]
MSVTGSAHTVTVPAHPDRPGCGDLSAEQAPRRGGLVRTTAAGGRARFSRRAVVVVKGLLNV